MALPKRKLVVDQADDDPVETHVLAQAIVKISKAAEDLAKSGLSRKAIVVLLADKTGFGKRSIEIILDALADLRKDYCR